MVDGVIKAMGIQGLGRDIGLLCVGGPIGLHIITRSAKSFASRRGLVTAHHVDARCMGLQTAAAERRVLVVTISGVRIPGNMMTKNLGTEALTSECLLMSAMLQWRPGAWGSGRGGCGRQPMPLHRRQLCAPKRACFGSRSRCHAPRAKLLNCTT